MFRGNTNIIRKRPNSEKCHKCEEECGRVLSVRLIFIQHQRVHTGKPFQCKEMWEEVLVASSFVGQTSENSHRERPYECNYTEKPLV